MTYRPILTVHAVKPVARKLPNPMQIGKMRKVLDKYLPGLEPIE